MSNFYRSLVRIGLSDYEINPDGKIHNIRTGEFVERTGDLPQPNTEFPRMVGLDGSGIRYAYLVAMAWYDQDCHYWQNSQYASNIDDARRFFKIAIGDKRATGITDNYGNPYVITRYGELWNTTTFNSTRGIPKDTGYLGISIRDRGKVSNFFMHRLVAEGFCNIPSGLIAKGYTKETLVVNHRDGNKHNNNWFNLEWITSQQNTTHASEHGLMDVSISDEDLNFIFKLLQNGKTDTEISDMMNIPVPSISSIRGRRSPRYNTPNYTWPRKSSEVIENRKIQFVQKIIDDYNVGMDRIAICEKHRIPAGRLTSILMANRSKITRYYRSNSRDLTEKQVRDVCSLIMQHKSNTEIAALTGVPQSSVSSIRMRKSYGQWSRDYEFPDSSECDERAQLKRKYTEIILAPENKDLSTSQLAEKYNLKANTINHYKRKLGLRENKVN